MLCYVSFIRLNCFNVPAVGSRNLVPWTELELNNCSEGLKLFRPLPGHLIKNQASSSAVLPSGSVYNDWVHNKDLLAIL